MAYQIWLGNPYELHYDWQALCLEVAKLFRPVIRQFDRAHRRRKLNEVRCNSRFDRPQVSSPDLLVYVVAHPNYGFIGADFAPGRRELHAGGLTVFAGKVCSEAYVADGPPLVGEGGVKLRLDRLDPDSRLIDVNVKRDPAFMAKLVYHEALHNRTGRGRSLHNVTGVSLGKKEIGPSDRQSPKDIELMANSLLRKTPQWDGGWAALNTRWGPRTRPTAPQNP